jgi:tRNA dimethylallyltransferase
LVGVDKPIHQFIYILGPTGVGKSDFALKFAQINSWPIINIDSLQVYKHLDIGTAKPLKEEMKAVPHYLFDYVSPPKVHSAADYLKDLSHLIERNKINKALFVGGSGFYIQAVQKGLYPKSNSSEEVKKKVNEWIDKDGILALYSWIQQKDFAFSTKISVNDHYRIRRSTEIMMSQNKTMTELKEQMSKESLSPLPNNRFINIGFRLEKSEILKRIQIRTKKMLEMGFIEEVLQIREMGLKDWQPLLSVGYKEVGEFLDNNESLSLLEEKINTSTMQLIKKQMTWFRRSPDINWFNPNEANSAFKTISEWSFES